MVFDSEDQLSFDIDAMVLPLKRLYKGTPFRITDLRRQKTSFKVT